MQRGHADGARAHCPPISLQDVAGGSQAVDSIALSDEQQRVVALVKAGKNVFYTGASAWVAGAQQCCCCC